MRLCAHCDQPLPPPKATGRPARFCPPPKECRRAAYKLRDRRGLTLSILAPSPFPDPRHRPDEAIARAIMISRSMAAALRIAANHSPAVLAGAARDIAGAIDLAITKSALGAA